MDKIYRAVVILSLICLSTLYGVDKYNTRSLLSDINNAEAQLEFNLDLTNQLGQSQVQMYPLVTSVNKLTAANLALITREKKATSIVLGLEQENRLLNVALNESVANLKKMVEENNDLIDADMYRSERLAAQTVRINELQQQIAAQNKTITALEILVYPDGVPVPDEVNPDPVPDEIK